jgi:hypothetical protein
MRPQRIIFFTYLALLVFGLAYVMLLGVVHR